MQTTAVPAVQTPVALQISLPLQALPSEHEVPAATATWVTPATGSQLSVVHGLLSLVGGGVPAIQTPEPLQTSLPLQRLLSAQEVPAAMGVCVTPVTGSHVSAVHGLPSSTGGMVPGKQVPVASQAPTPVQMLPSVQGVPGETGVCVTPLTESHASAVHGLLSSTGTAEPGTQAPAWQASPAVQALLSLHVVPFDLVGFEHTPVAALQVPAT